MCSMIRVAALSLGLLATLAFCVSCDDSVERERTWSSSISAPAQFRFWQGGPQAVALPASEADFIRFVEAAGGTYFITGQGDARLISPIPPRSKSPCNIGIRNIVVGFPIDASGAMPGYTAFVNAAGLVDCVERTFSFASF